MPLRSLGAHVFLSIVLSLVCCVCVQSEGQESEDEDDASDDYADSDASDAPVTPRRKRSTSTKKRPGQVVSSNPGGSGAKRLKKASDKTSYAITETKLPGSSIRPPTGQTAGRSFESPVGTPPARSSPHGCGRPMLGLSPPVSSPPPTAPTGIPLPEGVLDTGRHKHHSFDWLYKNRVDGNRRKPDNPLYNPRTLYVPPSFLAKETPAMVQWWKFKSENMDTVLFFKVRLVVYLSLPRVFLGFTPLLEVYTAIIVRHLPGLFDTDRTNQLRIFRRSASSTSCFTLTQTLGCRS